MKEDDWYDSKPLIAPPCWPEPDKDEYFDQWIPEYNEYKKAFVLNNIDWDY